MFRHLVSGRVRRWVVAVLVAVVALGSGGFGLLRVVDSRTFQFFGGVTDHVDTSTKVVALTFDDGPDPVGVQPTLDVLRSRAVPATFFLIGQQLAAHPELGREIAQAGMEIGNHSFSHQRMVLVSPGWIADEVEGTDALIRQTGYSGEILFRPPNGKKLLGLPYYLAQHHRPTIMWDIEPNSYPDVDRSAAAITRYTVDHVRPGSIVELHPMYAGQEPTRQAIGPIIDLLQQRGYRFVTVSQLLTYQGN